MTQMIRQKPLRFLHIGDLHLTEPGLQNHLDLHQIIVDANCHLANRIDFAFLPGDNANEGRLEQFQLIYEEMSLLRAPWHAISGDHDFEQKSLDNFYRGLKVRPLPYAEEIAGYCCMFLDQVSAGTGGPDFQLGDAQLRRLCRQLDRAQANGMPIVVFMHAYPADLRKKAEAEQVSAMFADASVILVDMGHTHYNEIANDGRTIYAATRSTGQVEEGDVGFAIVAIDDGNVSWRFKPLGTSWPLVMITSPADRRLMTRPHSPAEDGNSVIKVAAFGAVPIAEAVFRIDDGMWQPMYGGDSGLFSAVTRPPNSPYRLSVRVTDQNWNRDTDTIEVGHLPLQHRRPTGSDADNIGAWPERHLWATQLGPNRNGRKW